MRYQLPSWIILLVNIFCYVLPVQANDASHDKIDNKNIVQIDESHTEYDMPWSDKFHQSISNSVHRSVAWFDRFFMAEGDEQISPKTSARILLGWEPRAREFDQAGMRFRLRVRLPHLKDKVDIIFSDTDNEQFENLPLESLNANNNAGQDSFSAAIRYFFTGNDNVITDSRIGIRGGDIFARLRHKRIYSWSKKHRFSIEPALFYFLSDQFGARLLLEYDYEYDEHQQFRLNYSLRGAQAIDELRWQYGMYHLQQLSNSDAVITGVQMEGQHAGQRGSLVEEYLFSSRYRFNAYKSWLFFEIEPFLQWTEVNDYKTTPGIAFRVEGFFHRN